MEDDNSELKEGLVAALYRQDELEKIMHSIVVVHGTRIAASESSLEGLETSVSAKFAELDAAMKKLESQFDRLLGVMPAQRPAWPGPAFGGPLAGPLGPFAALNQHTNNEEPDNG
jgi:hypothetical protein